MYVFSLGVCLKEQSPEIDSYFSRSLKLKWMRSSRDRGWDQAECGWHLAECGWHVAECRWDLAECGWDLVECGWDLAECGWHLAECGWNLAECGWDLAECGWHLAEWGWDLAERLERLTANAKAATVLGSSPASSDTVDLMGGRWSSVE